MINTEILAVLTLFMVQGHQSVPNPETVKAGFDLFTTPIDVNLSIVEAVKQGDDLTITCSYDLHGDNLYAAKLFFGEHEFYRFVPQNEPKIHVFALPARLGSVRMQKSGLNVSQLTLEGVSTDWTGKYKCEVSADQPTFQTVIVARRVIVTEDPVTMPIVTVNKRLLTEGDILRAKCSSVGGSPPANLTWFINGSPVVDAVSVRSRVIEGEVDESVSDLEVVAPFSRQETFILSCTATQFNLYNSTSSLRLRVKSGTIPPHPVDKNTGFRVCREGSVILSIFATFLVNLLAHNNLR